MAGLTDPIPKIFWRVWIQQDEHDTIPERFERYWDRLRELHPSWLFRTCYDIEGLEWQGTKDLYDQATTDAGRADVVRFVLMYQFGGVYVDTDYEPLKAFDPLLEDDSPFAGWEKDGLLCPTVLGGPPEHPAYKAVLDLLPKWAIKFPPSKPNLQTGPRPFTHAWRWRHDVRTYPRETFYPVGWWERDKLGGPYPPESYGVHHWEQSWESRGKSADRRSSMISVLAPFRETGDGWRSGLWAWVRERLSEELPEAQIIECSDDGIDPFNKCLAVNRGAEMASGDVLYILDTDCYCSGDAVRHAVGRLDPNGWARPWRRKLKLGERATRAILAGGMAAWDRRADPPEHVNAFWCSPPLLMPRAVFEDVGGMDERYRGWGGEDTAFGRALWKTGHGFASNGSEDCVHLWHPRLGQYGRDKWEGQVHTTSNQHLDREYNRAKNEQDVRALIARR